MLKLKFKEINQDTKEFMIKAISSNYDYYTDAVNKIQEVLPSENTYILNSANSCLLTIVESLEEPILVQDEGGWNGFIKSCEVFGKTIEKIETDNSLINIEILSNYLEGNDINSLYITSLAGYTACQPLKEISDLCDTHNVVLIVDISGSVGDTTIRGYGDIQVSSTGSPKIINIENGGFINDLTGKLNFNKHLLKSLKADNITCAGIVNEIGKATTIYKKTCTMNDYLKRKLNKKLTDNSNYKIVHPNFSGLNTIITTESKSKAKKLAYNIRQRIDINGNIITTGPNYNRIKKASVIIEVKNLSLESLTYENMDDLCNIIVEEIEKT